MRVTVCGETVSWALSSAVMRSGATLLGGILGGLLAIPLTAAGRVLMFRYVWKRRDARSGGNAPATPVCVKSKD